jgi:methyl-accepting chemotaxis protein
MRFSVKVLACTMVPAVVLAIAAALGVMGTRSVEQGFERYVAQEQAFNDAVTAMRAQGLQMGQALRNIVLDPSNERAHGALEAAADAFEESATTARALAAGDATRLLQEVGGLRERQRAIHTQIVAAAQSDREGAVKALGAEDLPVWREIQARLSTLAEQAHERMTAVRADAHDAATLTWLAVLAASIVGVLLGIVFPVLLKRILMRDLGGEPEAAREMVKAVAHGDLTRAVPVAAGDSTSLLAYLNQMRGALDQMMVGLRATVNEMNIASREIAVGNLDLSSRTEQQASNLQQTAASMEEMNSALKQSADAARQASQLAGRATAVAEKGGVVVGEVITTMDEITASSRKIGDIIGVIDGIAFQTNILALNAAVEAARAGEQGRGFAVVAGEVRTLAQRAAQAAREIKALIGASVDKVETGSRLVDDAGGTMREIVDQVKRVSDLIAEITSSTLEESSGIGQVNQAITQLDQMTQQNAALVEQSAAAAQSLREQADRLAQAVSVFKLSPSGAV